MSNCSQSEGKEKSIIETGKIYNSRLNFFVYTFISGGHQEQIYRFSNLRVLGLSVLMVAYAIYLTYKACKARDCETLECSRDELCSRL